MIVSDGLTVIEWADRATDILPADTIWFRLEVEGETERRITITGIDEDIASLFPSK